VADTPPHRDGGDQLVGALTDERTEVELGDRIREQEEERYFELIGEVELMTGSRGLIEDLKGRGHKVVLASSAKADEVDHYLDQLDARSLADAWTTSADVDATKPEPDLVRAALERIGGGAHDAVMIGDTPWDVEAAKRAGVATLAVRTGGFGAGELRESGALGIFESVQELRERLDETALA
jgi:HAD superfamily hydrolase (TIGR01549 family)